MALRIVMSLLLFGLQVAASNLSNIPAYDQQLTSKFSSGDGPILGYNGSQGVPRFGTLSPIPAPLPELSSSQVADIIFQEVAALATNDVFSSNCSKCVAATEMMHLAALTQPASVITDLLIRVCNKYSLPISASSCETEFSSTGGTGPYLAQLFQKMTLATGDMQAYCYYIWGYCDVPPVIEINEDEWFSPKPANKTTAPVPSGKTLGVLHFSDWHFDPRYIIGSEAACSQDMCCRLNSLNTKLQTTINNASLPASRFGNFLCDTTADLGLAAFASMHRFLNVPDLGFSIFTGDIISHDPDDQQSEAYVAFEEDPLYATLGNHDSIPSGWNTSNSMNGGNASSNAMAWNYQLLSSLWLKEGWIDNTTASYAATHYGAYATTTPQGLRIISINTDFWYTPNVFNYYNFTNPDNSGILRFLISELEKSEAINQRVWIIGHVPSGCTSGTTNPTALFLSIVRRFSPSTIAGIFYGHTHKDSKGIYYDAIATTNSTKNTTTLDLNKPLNVAWVGPSIAPRTNYNSGWSVYQIDAKTFSVINAQTYFANISNTLAWDEPEFGLEYDTRATYDPEGIWPATAPLNATFFHWVTGKMMNDPGLLDRYQFLETKSSNQVAVCSTDACREKAICQIRSGSAAQKSLC